MTNKRTGRKAYEIAEWHARNYTHTDLTFEGVKRE